MFFILFPLGHEQQIVRRLPLVTIVIIALCFLIYIPVQIMNRHAEEYLIQSETTIRDYYYAHQDKIKIDPNTLRNYGSADDWLKDHPPSSLTTEEEKYFSNSVLEALKYRDEVITVKYGFSARRWNIMGLITYQFLHSGWLHLIMNMWFLWLAGTTLEDLWGRFAFAVYYIVCGILAALTHGLFIGDSPASMIGASGAVAGLMGAFLVKFRTTRILMFYFVFLFFIIRKGTFKASALILLILWFLQQLFGALVLSGSSNVGFWAHVGGFAFGVGIAYALKWGKFEDKYLISRVEAITSYTQDPAILNAMKAFEENNYERVEKILVPILVKDPQNADARLLMFQIKNKQLDRSGAIGHLTCLLEHYIQKNDVESAIELYREHQIDYPDINFSLSSVMKLAKYFKETDNYDSADRLLQKTYLKHPDDIIGFKALAYYAEISVLMNKQAEARKAYDTLLNNKSLPEELRTHILSKMNVKVDTPVLPDKQIPALPENPAPAASKKIHGPIALAVIKISKLTDDGLSIILNESEQMLPWTSIKYLCVVRIKNKINVKPYHDYIIIDMIDTRDKETRIPVYRTFSFHLKLSMLFPDSKDGPMDKFITLIEKIQSKSHCIIIEPQNLYAKKFTLFALVNDYTSFLTAELKTV